MLSVFYSASPFGTGDIKTGSPNISITSGIATLDVQQTGNIGAGCAIEYNSLKAYIAPNRIAFTSGGTTPIGLNTKITGVTSGATSVVRAIDITSGSWAGGDAAGYIYVRGVNGTWQSGETINILRPTFSADVGTTASILQGNMGNGDTQFVVKAATGGDAPNQGSVAVTSIHHEFASLSACETGYVDASHINNADLTAANVMAYACCYYDHDDQTYDVTSVAINGVTTGASNYLYVYTPCGSSEAINCQRHPGKVSTSKYYLANGTDSYLLVDYQAYTVVDGLQIENEKTSGTAGCINVKNTSTAGTKHILNCILMSVGASSVVNNVYIDLINYATIVVLLNNVIEGNAYSGYGLYNTDIDANVYAYNNTFYECQNAVRDVNAQMTLKNNLFCDCAGGTVGSFTASCTHNLWDNCVLSEAAFGVTHTSGNATATSANKLVDGGGGLSVALVGSVIKNTTDNTYAYVTAVDSDTQLSLSADIFTIGEGYAVYTALWRTVVFENEVGRDYHLDNTDTAARGVGTNLSSDTYPVWDDIDRDERP